MPTFQDLPLEWGGFAPKTWISNELQKKHSIHY